MEDGSKGEGVQVLGCRIKNDEAYARAGNHGKEYDRGKPAFIRLIKKIASRGITGLMAKIEAPAGRPCEAVPPILCLKRGAPVFLRKQNLERFHISHHPKRMSRLKLKKYIWKRLRFRSKWRTIDASAGTEAHKSAGAKLG